MFYPRLAADALRARATAALRLDDEARRRPAAEGGEGAAGVDGRHLEPGAGVALGLWDPARQDDGPDRGARAPLRDRVGAPRRPRGAEPDDRPLDDGVDPDLVRRDAGARLPLRRALRRLGLARHRDRVHDPAGAPLLPDRLAARRRARGADLARALRPRLRVPRPSGRHRGRERERSPPRAATSPSTASRSATTTAPGRWTTSPSRRRGARRRRSSARPGRGRRPPATWSRASTTSPAAPSRSTAATCAS